MYYVYILQSINLPHKKYIGFTRNINQRLKDHNRGHSKHTDKFKPWKILHISVFKEQKTALRFEKYLKTASGKAFYKKRLI